MGRSNTGGVGVSGRFMDKHIKTQHVDVLLQTPRQNISVTIASVRPLPVSQVISLTDGGSWILVLSSLAHVSPVLKVHFMIHSHVRRSSGRFPTDRSF